MACRADDCDVRNKAPARKGDDIAARLLGFAADVLKASRLLRRGVPTTHVHRQLVQAATAGGANYEEARCAENRADFVHKVRISAKEMREAQYWLKLVVKAECTQNVETFLSLVEEADELIAILVSSANTAKAR